MTESLSTMLDQASIAMDQLVQSSLHDPLLAFPVYILAGLLSSTFPCVYPLIPVTVGFLQKRSTTERGKWMHPLFYWLGTVSMYAILGLGASIGGGAFNSIMQNGVVIVGTGFLFLFLAFAIMDWFPLQFSGGQKLMEEARSRSGYSFTFAMGLGAGLIASACVAPALVTMLLFIAQTSASGTIELSTVLYGSGLSAAFGIGIGTPLLLAGIIGARLPRSGGWMNYAKYLFALLILFAALYQFEKGFRVLGYTFMDIMLILGGLALIAFAAILGLKPPERSDRPALTGFIFALFALVIGSGIVIKGIAFSEKKQSSAEKSRSLSSFALTGPSESLYTDPKQIKSLEPDVKKEVISGVTFYRDTRFARSISFLENKPLFIDFYADWCTNCKDFYRLIGENEKLKHALQNDAIVLKIKDTDPEFGTLMDHPDYQELNVGLPFFAVLNPAGEQTWKTTNYRDTDGMIQALQSRASD